MKSKNNTLWLALIATLTLIAFFPVFFNQFVNWDDNVYIYDNPVIRSLSWKSIKTFFTEFFMGNYHPLAMLSIALDYAIDGYNPLVFHAHNLLLHIASALLVFLILQQLTQQLHLALIPALLFAIHPMHVESVVWAAERKDVLYAFYFLLAIYSYVHYLQKEKKLFYIWALVLFFLSLLAKGQAVVLAPALVLIDYFQGRKWLSKKVLLEKIPFFLLALVFGIIAIKAQAASNTIGLVEIKKAYHPLLFGAYGFCQYLWKLTFPQDLSTYYPYPVLQGDDLPNYFYYYLLGAVALLALMIFGIKRSKYLAFGILFYLINIVLVLQFLPVGTTIMADRFTYLSSIGFFFVIAYGAQQLSTGNKMNQLVVNTTIGAYILGLSAFTFQQTKVWNDSISLWEHVVKIYPYEPIPNLNLATAYDKAGRKYDAIKHYNIVIENAPKKYSSAAYSCRSEARRDLGMLAEAYQDALRGYQLFPQSTRTAHELGKVYEEMGRLDSALFYYDATLQIDSLHEDALLDKGIVSASLGDLSTSILVFDFLLEQHPEVMDGWFNRGISYAMQGHYKQAIKDYSKAIELKPDYPDFYNNRGYAYQQLNDYDAAIQDFSKTIELHPEHAFAYNNRGYLKFEIGNLDGALEDVNKSLELDDQNAYAYKNKALISFSTSPEEACEQISKGLTLAQDSIIKNELLLLQENCPR